MSHESGSRGISLSRQAAGTYIEARETDPDCKDRQTQNKHHRTSFNFNFIYSSTIKEAANHAEVLLYCTSPVKHFPIHSPLLLVSPEGYVRGEDIGGLNMNKWSSPS